MKDFSLHNKTQTQLIDELLQNVKTLREENARLIDENQKLKKRIEVILSEY
jgi:regulator of replication initiation timing